jgi:hypothetical protein
MKGAWPFGMRISLFQNHPIFDAIGICEENVSFRTPAARPTGGRGGFPVMSRFE